MKYSPSSIQRMRIAPGFFGSLFTGSRGWDMVIHGESLVYTKAGRPTIRVALAAISAAFVKQGAIWAEIRIEGDSQAIICDGVLNNVAEDFVTSLRRSVGESLLTAIVRHEPELNQLTAGLHRLLAERRYIAHRDMEVWRSTIASTSQPSMASLAVLVGNPLVPRERLSTAIGKRVDLLLDALSGKRDQVRTRNKQFVAEEIVRHKVFFDSVEKTPLTSEQRIAAVVMEDRNLVVAAAGSGKTSTIVGKVGYALLSKQCVPSDFLVLAFNNDAAKELDERINGQLRALLPAGGRIKAKTFHAFGLEIIAAAEDRKPSIANFAAANEAADAAYIDKLIQQQLIADRGFAVDWVMFRAVCGKAAKNPAEFESLQDWDDYVRVNGDYKDGRRGFVTIQGEIVKSQGELAIANWLYMQGVPYEYERPYEYDTADSQHRQYHPDFYLPDIDTYLEHYALDKNGRPPAAFGSKYVASMEWKAQLHADKATKLITTTFADFISGELFQKLESMLTVRGQEFMPRPTDDVLARLNELQRADYSSLLRTFLKHAKSNEVDEAALHARINSNPNPHRARLFVRVAWKLLLAYEALLRENDEIDFEDMIVRATRDVASHRYMHGFKIILVDEFQDISQARAKLIKALLAQAPDCKLFAVGDDWQSIYRFAGSDIDVFTRFETHFGITATSYLTQTFRSNQGVTDVAAKFIQKNPGQLRKGLRALDQTREGAVVVRRYGRLEEMAVECEASLTEIAETLSEGKRASVFVLARYRFQEPKELKAWKTHFRALDITFKTVHSSKGLQADFVIVMGLHSGRYAFPSEIADDPLLQLVMPAAEPFPNAEERRVFYVAMTRARRRVYLIGGRYTPSGFLQELSDDVTLERTLREGTLSRDSLPESWR